MSNQQDDLAYGEEYEQSRGAGGQGDRGIVGDTFRFLKERYKQSQQPQQAYGYGQQQTGPGGQAYNVGPQSGQQQPYGQGQSANQPPYGQASYNTNTAQQNQPPYSSYPGGQQKPDLASKVFDGLHGAITSIGSDIAGKLGTHYEPQPYGTYAGSAGYGAQGTSRNRFGSFAAPKNGNDVKWHVDGCSYMWAVSKALEGARESIWIMDWWLSPELYLRRPPAKNEQYRLDRILQRAAQRGVRVNVIVYKEVTQALTLSSSHTKHALEALHPNIAVFRHPDHLPDAQTIESSLTTSFQSLSLDAAKLSRMGSDTLKSIYGMSDGVILYWAHHEKLCLVDGNIAFMGGLDLCFGRWDTNQHAIADVHPTDLNMTVFPGQDYNNARIMDFSDVANPDQNKLDRRLFSRMGWSDISVSLHGPCVQDLRRHFVDRWNFIYDEKYNVRKDIRYSRLSLTGQSGDQTYSHHHQASQSRPQSQPQYNTLQPQAANPSSTTTSSTSRPNSSYGGNPPQFPPPPGSTGTPQPSWQSNAPPPQSQSQPSWQSNAPPPQTQPQPSWQSNAPPPHAQPQPSWQSGAPTPQTQTQAQTQPSWQSSAPPSQPQAQPAYQQQQQQNPYGLPVPSWQTSSQSKPPPQSTYQSPPQSQAPQPGYLSGAEGGQHFPPPPPGGPPHVTSPPPPQQTGPYGYETPTHSQHDFATAELPGSVASQGSSDLPHSLPTQKIPPTQPYASPSGPTQISPPPSSQQPYASPSGPTQKIPPPPSQQPYVPHSGPTQNTAPPPSQQQYAPYSGPAQNIPPHPAQQPYGPQSGPAQNAPPPSSQQPYRPQSGPTQNAPPPPSQQQYVPYSGPNQNTPPPPSQQAYVPYSPPVQGVTPPPLQQTRGFDEGLEDYDDPREGERGFRGASGRYRDEGRRLGSEITGITSLISDKVETKLRNVHGKASGSTDQYGRPLAQGASVMQCQIIRSCTKWSAGIPTEHSIQDAYISAIENSQYFVYIENQFFITATGNEQKPVSNQIGKALVDRILKAARSGEKYKVIVIIPSVPGFAGDLRDDSALGTRAIMEFQYNSINRGGHSIMELIAKAGYNPLDYIRFYNLRSYDRLNVNSALLLAEQQSGVNYEDARKQNDDALAAGSGAYGTGTTTSSYNPGPQYQQYQQAAHQVAATKPYSVGSGRWDTVSECYMLGGEDLRNVPWDYPGELSEIDAFVSEELYIHSKVLIADDRIVICGSANLNDRSQLGTHDSEIAIVVEDQTPVQSTMNGRPFQANRFAASLRRQLFRKHLGLLRPQDMQRPDANFDPVGVPNSYDWGSPEDNVVADPLSDTFQSLWNSRARQNTDIFRQVFRAVPDDSVRNWNEYKEFYEYYFNKADAQAQGKQGVGWPVKYLWGHIVRDDFPPGPEGIKQVKDLLSRVKGTLVEMPLVFLAEEDIAKEGISLNAVTEQLYT